MSIKEKLSVFSASVMDEAEAKSRNMLNAIDEEFTEACRFETEAARQKADETLRRETEKAQKDSNNEHIAVTTLHKKELIAIRTQLIDQLFRHLKERLIRFTSSGSAYEKYLIDRIRKVCEPYEQAGLDDPTADSLLEIALTPADMQYAEAVRKAVRVHVREAGEDFIGGFRLTIRTKNQMLDESFLSKLREQREGFSRLRIY